MKRITLVTAGRSYFEDDFGRIPSVKLAADFAMTSFLSHGSCQKRFPIMDVNISEEALELMRQFIREMAAQNKRAHDLAVAVLAAFPTDKKAPPGTPSL